MACSPFAIVRSSATRSARDSVLRFPAFSSRRRSTIVVGGSRSSLTRSGSASGTISPDRAACHVVMRGVALPRTTVAPAMRPSARAVSTAW